MGHITLTGIRKSFGTVEVLHDIDLESATASSWSSSAPPAAASPRCCA